MDEEGFTKFMRENKKSERAVNRYLLFIETFERYLSEHKRESLEEATPDDIRDFATWNRLESKKVPQYLWAIRTYFEYKPNELMFNTARELIGRLYMENYKLKDFRGVNPEFVEKLSSKGIKTAKQMLDVGHSIKGREKLAEETGIPIDSVLEFVKLSNLARIPGLKKIRARLYYDAGLDTLDKIAKLDPEEMREMLTKFIEKNHFNGIAPLPKEAAASVSLARYLPRIVEYQRSKR